MKNEELRMKNWGAFAPSTLAGVFDRFVICHKIFGLTCETRGLRSNPNSSFLILHSSLIIILQFLLVGCVSHARYDNSARLIARADFEAARVAAPEWCRDALKTINELELEIERR